MINTNELRIGNCVNEESAVLIGSFILQKINSISGDTIEVITPSGSIKNTRLYYCHPIPITSVRLIACGFEEKEKDSWFPHFEIKNTRLNELVEYCFRISTRGNNEWRWIEGNANVPIYYLHQLQNLYFALTNKELEYNPTNQE